MSDFLADPFNLLQDDPIYVRIFATNSNGEGSNNEESTQVNVATRPHKLTLVADSS